MTNGAMRLREMERQAKQAKKGIWVNYVPQNTGQTKLSDTFLGKVVEVVSGDTLVIKDINGGGVERRVSLSRSAQHSRRSPCTSVHVHAFMRCTAERHCSYQLRAHLSTCVVGWLSLKAAQCPAIGFYSPLCCCL